MEKDKQNKKEEYRNYLSQTAGLFGVLILLTLGLSYISLRALLSNTGQEQPLMITQEIVTPNPEQPLPAQVSNDGPLVSEPQASDLSVNTFAVNCTTSSSGIDSEEQKMIALINNYRAENGVSTLGQISTLNTSAAWMAEDLARNNYLGHTDTLGRDLSRRAADCGYDQNSKNVYIAENLATQTNDAFHAFDSWLASPGHKANLLDSRWKSMGIGRAQLADGRWSWANHFTEESSSGTGSPPPAKPIKPSATPRPTTIVPTSPPATCDTAAQLQGHSSYQAFCAASNQCTGTPSTSGNQLSCPCVPCANPTQPTQPTATIAPNPTITSTPVPNQPTATPTLPPQTTDIRIDLSLALSGIGTNTASGQNPNPINQTRQVSLEILDLNGNKVGETSGNLTAQTLSTNQLGLTYGYRGIVGTNNLQNGAYNLRVRFENTLWKNLGLAALSNNQTYISSAQILTSGDMNFDNVLDLADYNQILTCINSAQSSQANVNAPIICALADFNLDGKIDERDLNIFYDSLANRHGD